MPLKATDQVAAVEAGPAGAVRPTGLASFKAALAAHHDDFVAWRGHPFTRVFRAALTELLIRPMADTPDVSIHYGLMQGVALARQLCDDPSVVWPDVVKGEPSGPAASMPDMDFETPIDDIFDVPKQNQEKT